ncbi:hypothetical protein JO972_10660 [Verrucomicrobiaceae bacterium 5K15]|uniref:Uncharacterized protein n=1 Tax=Oceaniferula flava TaxID=2800421 RepID=A0AAE2SC16_9BACT|nr:hypothetical protein [Oceaniferula flavus]MBK1855421.1 hypothetical protein [Oceaniferula flavus]MBM1136727.1 hypothetical protein [Oceaniferula flavus]
MNPRNLPSPNRLFAWYQSGEITREQWIEGMRQQFLLALREIEEDRADPKLALMESWRCKSAVRRLTKEHTETELREVFMALAEIDDFPPATYLWNADQHDVPLFCFLREKRDPVLRFTKMQIRRMSADLSIEYGGLKSKDRVRERIRLRRDWRGVLTVESRETS